MRWRLPRTASPVFRRDFSHTSHLKEIRPIKELQDRIQPHYTGMSSFFEDFAETLSSGKSDWYRDGIERPAGTSMAIATAQHSARAEGELARSYTCTG